MSNLNEINAPTETHYEFMGTSSDGDMIKFIKDKPVFDIPSDDTVVYAGPFIQKSLERPYTPYMDVDDAQYNNSNEYLIRGLKECDIIPYCRFACKDDYGNTCYPNAVIIRINGKILERTYDRYRWFFNIKGIWPETEAEIKLYVERNAYRGFFFETVTPWGHYQPFAYHLQRDNATLSAELGRYMAKHRNI